MDVFTINVSDENMGRIGFTSALFQLGANSLLLAALTLKQLPSDFP